LQLQIQLVKFSLYTAHYVLGESMDAYGGCGAAVIALGGLMPSVNKAMRTKTRGGGLSLSLSQSQLQSPQGAAAPRAQAGDTGDADDAGEGGRGGGGERSGGDAGTPSKG
jgi:hypothetical protein